ncbi:MAG: phosphotransferase family protein [Candidatus Heimdallarchaeota archaeon]
MSFEERRKQDISILEVIDALYVFFHDIKRQDIKFLYHGTYNVFEIKKKYIFRIPDIHFRNINGVNLIKRELKILNIIEDFIPFSIPEPTYISIEPNYPLIGYEKIEGIRLSQCFKKASKNQKFKVAEQIGLFLSYLHSDMLRDVISNEMGEHYSAKQYEAEWHEYYNFIQKKIFTLMNSTQREWVNKLFKKFLGDKENFLFKPTLVHGDFDTSNILVNPKTFELSGIIDFEDSRIYDPAADFLFFKEGRPFLDNILSSYQRETELNFINRAAFLYGRNFLPYITFGIDNNIPEMIRAGFELLDYKMNTIW